MKKDFDFDDIGKRTPYRTPDGFFEDVQRKVMERAGVKQQRKSHTKLIISTVITIAAVWVGFLFVPSLRQADEVTTSSSKVLANGTEPCLNIRKDFAMSWEICSWSVSVMGITDSSLPRYTLLI